MKKKSENLEVRSQKGDQSESFSLPNSHFSLPKQRFPEFRKAEGWKLVTLGKASVPVAERV
ncbi:MAG: hypothetical protein ACOYOI_09815, partial [Chthoniobacterales bacterium]